MVRPLVLLVVPMLVSCSPSDRAVGGRSIPGPPSFLTPVGVATPSLGEDAVVVAGRERAGRVEANRRITAGRDAWVNMQAQYAKRGM